VPAEGSEISTAEAPEKSTAEEPEKNTAEGPEKRPPGHVRETVVLVVLSITAVLTAWCGFEFHRALRVGAVLRGCIYSAGPSTRY